MAFRRWTAVDSRHRCIIAPKNVGLEDVLEHETAFATNVGFLRLYAFVHAILFLVGRWLGVLIRLVFLELSRFKFHLLDIIEELRKSSSIFTITMYACSLETLSFRNKHFSFRYKHFLFRNRRSIFGSSSPHSIRKKHGVLTSMNQDDPRSDLWTFLAGSPNRNICIQLSSPLEYQRPYSHHISQTSAISKNKK